MIVRTIGYCLTIAYIAIGVHMGWQMNVDILTEAYPWADHMPAVCILAGAAAGLCNAMGFALVFGTKS